MNEALKTPWHRSTNGVIAGVCKGVAEKFEVETWIVRLIWIVASVYFGIGILLYIFMVVALPTKDQLDQVDDKVILGVCSKLAKRLNWDVGLTRVAALVLAVSSLGATVIGYLLIYLLVDDFRS